MLGWLRRNRKPRVPTDVARCLDQFAQPLALMVAVAEVCSVYARGVRAGQIDTPAYARKNDSVVSIWQDTRTEALSYLDQFGNPDIKALTDPPCQLNTLNCFLDERPHLEYPQPRGEQPADTLQAVFHVYLFLNKAGSSVCDRDTDYKTLKSKNLKHSR